MNYQAEVIGMDGRSHIVAYMNAESEAHARSLLALCGIDLYADLREVGDGPDFGVEANHD